MSRAAVSELRSVLGDAAVIHGPLTGYGSDATEHEGLVCLPEAAVAPHDTDEVRRLVEWAYARGVPLAARWRDWLLRRCCPGKRRRARRPLSANRLRAFDPGSWRMHVEAGVTTGTVRRLARENGLCFPPDPGAAEQSQIGGNIATNAGGPHAFKYGVTGAWVTGLEAVVPPGEVITVGGAIRKDVAGYDLKSLLIGSEGTLGIITAAWLRLIPAPESTLLVVAAYPNTATGCLAIEAVLASGVVPAAIEFLDRGALHAARGAFPVPLPDAAGFIVVAEADGSPEEAARAMRDLREALEPGSVAVWAPGGRAEASALWRWRDGVSIAVAAQRGGKVSEDIVVPVDRLREAIDATLEIGERFDLPACSWGHAGDGNLHSTFLVDAGTPEEVARAHQAAEALHEMATRFGGSISGEHGIGWLKRGRLELQLGKRALALHREIKNVFDPKNLMNPGKKQ